MIQSGHNFARHDMYKFTIDLIIRIKITGTIFFQAFNDISQNVSEMGHAHAPANVSANVNEFGQKSCNNRGPFYWDGLTFMDK